eukprot:TRINITY_DN1886_c0_g1_i2.p2 TRINITY_DN1886_c0_g1~~TRINITY_DN1886_c0_g1_i2.p2  ORF type:complete len:197 (-),score=-20.57 TRINITY_DN1886_c0_g1_i2:454-1044(-)
MSSHQIQSQFLTKENFYFLLVKIQTKNMQRLLVETYLLRKMCKNIILRNTQKKPNSSIKVTLLIIFLYHYLSLNQRKDHILNKSYICQQSYLQQSNCEYYFEKSITFYKQRYLSHTSKITGLKVNHNYTLFDRNPIQKKLTRAESRERTGKRIPHPYHTYICITRKTLTTSLYFQKFKNTKCELCQSQRVHYEIEF